MHRGQRHEHHRDAKQHPPSESQLEAVDVGDVCRQQRVGRRADRGGHAPGGGAVRNSKEEGGAELCGGGAWAIAVGKKMHDRHRDWQHHQRGGGVADPHADEGGRQEEPGDDP